MIALHTLYGLVNDLQPNNGIPLIQTNFFGEHAKSFGERPFFNGENRAIWLKTGP
jgi:hypothetical protein